MTTETANHTHAGETDDDDVCIECDALFCPDTLTEVTYDEDRYPAYAHADGSTCFLHQAAA